MNPQLNKILKPSVLVPVLTGITTFAGGLAVGYFLGKRDRKVVFIPNESELAKIQHDVDEMKERREAREAAAAEAKKPIVPEVTVAEHIQRKLDHVGEGTPEEVASVPHNVFAQQNWGEWDYEVEKRSRDSATPYVIHEEEFHTNELGFNQLSYLYYAGDDTLADIDLKPLYERHLITGDNLKFGHGSRDPNVVFIRNEERREEYEVTFDPGSHAFDVQGLEAEGPPIQHSAPPKHRPPQE